MIKKLLLIVAVMVLIIDCSIVQADLLTFRTGYKSSLELADYSMMEDYELSYFGHRAVSAGDVDGDGLDDILVSAMGNTTYGELVGRAYIFLAKNFTGELDADHADYILYGTAPEQRAGYSIAALGDVDGDGRADIAVGSPTYPDRLAVKGQVAIITGKDLKKYGHSIPLDNASYILLGENHQDGFGASIAGLGDIDGDGRGDFVVGAMTYGSYYGKIYVFTSSTLKSGESTADIATYSYQGSGSEDRLGLAVANAGDVDGDGLNDIIAGAQYAESDKGAAYLIYTQDLTASKSSIDDIAAYRFFGSTANHLVGYSVAGAGDVDGDGLDDLLIGSNYSLGSYDYGHAFLVYAQDLKSSTDLELLNDASVVFSCHHSGNWCGFSVAGAGDVDGDGLDDFLIGDPYNSQVISKGGAAFLFLGASLSSKITSIEPDDADYQFYGEKKSSAAGNWVATAGDINADGLSDIIIGATGYDIGEKTNEGKVYVIQGAVDTCSTPTSIVYVDAKDGMSLKKGGSGSAGCPVNNISDGITIAGKLGLNEVEVVGYDKIYYREKLTIDVDNLTIRGVKGVSKTRDSELSLPKIHFPKTLGHLIEIKGSNVTFENFILYNRGIKVSGASNVSLNKNIIFQNKTGTPFEVSGGAQSIEFNNNLVMYKRAGSDPMMLIGSLSKNIQIINNTFHFYDNSEAAMKKYDVKFIETGGLVQNLNLQNSILEYTPYVDSLSYETSSHGDVYGFDLNTFAAIAFKIKYNKLPDQHQDPSGYLSIDSTNTEVSRHWYNKADFVDPQPSGDNYQLQSISSFVDVGNPDSSYDDNDGSQNDLGAYGGGDPLEY